MRRCVPPRGGGQRPTARVPVRVVLRLAGGAAAAVLSAAFLPAGAAAAAMLPGRAPGHPAQPVTANPALAATGGAVLAWGDGANGQLGNGKTTDRLLPTPVHLPPRTKI